MPKGYNKSFAEMDLKEKGTISHRGKAIQQLVHFLNNHFWLIQQNHTKKHL